MSDARRDEAGGLVIRAALLAAAATPVSAMAQEAALGGDGPLVLVSAVAGAGAAAAAMLALGRLSRRRTLAARRRQQALELALDAISSGLIALDGDGRIALANAAARRMLGLRLVGGGPEPWPRAARFRPAEAGAETAGDAAEPDDARPDDARPDVAILGGAHLRGVEYRLFVDGRPDTRLRVSGAPGLAEGPFAAIMTLEDVTEQHRARILGDRAERLDALGKLTGGVAHDFNNLLSTIMGAVQLAQRRSGGDPRIARHLDAALRATRTGADLVDRLLGFAKRGAAKIESVSVEALFADLEPLARNAMGPNVRLDIAPGDGVAHARCDRSQIVTALLNLVANSRDAILSDRGAGRVTIATRTAPGEPRFIEIAVADDGPGMTPEVRARALDPFYTTKGPSRGTGLGLSMVYGALRRCGGDLRIESAPGAGATVRLRLPACEAAPRPAPAAGGRAEAGAGRAILLVDDEPDLLELAREMLGEIGYAVIPAESGEAALEALDRGHVVEALVTDIVMPRGMSGLELARRARQARPDLPVVLASGYAEQALSEEQPVDAPIVRKPYEIEQLAEAVRAAIAARGGRSRKAS